MYWPSIARTDDDRPANVLANALGNCFKIMVGSAHPTVRNYVIQVRSTNVVSMRDSWKRGVGKDFLVQPGRGADSIDTQFAQCSQHALDRFAARRLMDDQLADHRVVIGRDGIAAVGVRIESHAETAGGDQPFDPSRRGLKIARAGLRR